MRVKMSRRSDLSGRLIAIIFSNYCAVSQGKLCCMLNSHQGWHLTLPRWYFLQLQYSNTRDKECIVIKVVRAAAESITDFVKVTTASWRDVQFSTFLVCL